VNILGNYVGTDALGTIALGNQAFGVNIRDSQNVLVRDNLLSGNAHSGLSIRGATAADNRVMGNHVGTDASGTAALANGLHGIVLTQGAHGNRIGGTSTGNGNLISGNQGMGVYVAGADTRYNRLRNNYIGVDETATIDLGNLQYGLFLDGSQANTVTGNVISGNEGFGVVIAGLTASENGLYANSIGTDASGAMNLGNGWHGVRVSDGAHNNRIGGGSPETANRIAFNVIDGVSLAGSNTIENAILGNSIYQNAGFGIDLGDNGFSPNDVGDPDVGTNMFQNYPELISISRLVSGDLQISYRVDSLPGFSNYPIRVEFFQADSSGQEGMVYLGFDLYRSADAAVGTKTFVFQPLVATGTGQRLVATATDGMGLLNTSEFSPDQFVV
jgi:parallel beta-helix repeat protein